MLDPQPNGPVIPQAPVKRTNIVWRFYVDPQGGWRWQQLTSDHSVLCDSASAYATYDESLRDAEAHGYKFMRSQEKVAPPSRANARFGEWR